MRNLKQSPQKVIDGRGKKPTISNSQGKSLPSLEPCRTNAGKVIRAGEGSDIVDEGADLLLVTVVQYTGAARGFRGAVLKVASTKVQRQSEPLGRV